MVSKSKKIVALLLTAMMAATALAGCGGSGSQTSTPSSTNSTPSTASQSSSPQASKAETVDLDSEAVINTIKDRIAEEAAKTDGVINMTFWCASDDKNFEEGLKKQFEKKYADSRYKFKIKVAPIGEDKAGGKILEGPQDGADVFNFADDQLSSLVSAGAIASIADIFNNNVIANNSANSVEVCSVKNVAYAFPKTSDNGYFMYYDKTVFDEADVENMDTMIEKAAAKGKGVFLSLGNAWYNTAFFFSAGCKIKFENDVQTATFNSEEGISAVKAMCHLAEKQGNGFEGDAGSAGENAFIAQGFKDGKLAAAVTGTWEGPAIADVIGKENLGAAKLPTVLMNGEQVQLQSFGGYKLIGVNAYTDYPITAQALAYYLSSADSQILRYKNRGLIPTSTKALEDEAIKTDPALQAIEAQTPYSHAQGQCVGGKYWGAGVGDYGGNIVNKKGQISDDQIKSDLAKIEGKMK